MSVRAMGLLGLFPELLDCICSFLSSDSIRNLMVNRSLREICEPILYRDIKLYHQPRRSLKLLHTFALRPDLALFVRVLVIDPEWLSPYPHENLEIPAILQPDGMKALALAHNIRSFTTSSAPWLSVSNLSSLRNVISQMSLTSLSISEIIYGRRDPEIAIKQNETIISNLWEVLRAQPLLETLKITFIPIVETEGVRPPFNLQREDIPNLRSLDARADIAANFLPVANQLEELATHSTRGEMSFLVETLKNGGERIRKLSATIYSTDMLTWQNLGSLFPKFPNVEVLKIAAVSIARGEDVPPPEFYFNMIASQSKLLSRLRHITIGYHDLVGELDGPPELDEQQVDLMKRNCPLLTAVVGPSDYKWAFKPGRDGS